MGIDHAIGPSVRLFLPLRSDQQHNIIKCGKTKAGRQRYKCKTCDGTFTETKGTIFYRRRTSEDEIIDTLALIGKGIGSAAWYGPKGTRKTRSSIVSAKRVNTQKRWKRCCCQSII